MASTLTEYLQSQEELAREAALAIPHQFSQCTYSLGPLRQAVYLCLTCPEARGLCSACSVACHTDHEQIELFPKRGFRCDCPTVAIGYPCTLSPNNEPENALNAYGQNFKAIFCRCGRPYDAKNEREAMIQCLACEDWFHESCCNLRERPSTRENTPAPPMEAPTLPIANQSADSEEPDDAASDASSSGLPPPLISGDDYESFVCGACVSSNATLKRWAGTYGAMMVVRDDLAGPWRCLNGLSTEAEGSALEADLNSSSRSGAKRPLSPSAFHEPDAKRAKASSNAPLLPSSRPCLAPPQDPLACTVLANLNISDPNTSLGAGDIFFTLGFRDRWCHCDSCLPSLTSNPYLLQDEETYEHPDDPDSGLSLEELGIRALERIPRERAIDGIHAFNEMRDDLVKYLRPFAQDGKVVGESDVHDFFASLIEAKKKGRK
ncbi:hypothetical protein B0H34DRAFT_660833 [Crassisporium funariophilum]|nr:hypothetical protein B0H34DRAFT_660833 [Crassisporium funariophilum]